jgi:hypothetical protein
MPKPPSRRLFAGASFALAAALALVVSGALVQNACTPSDPQSRAYRVTSRAQLIGGPNALGEIGDYLLENDQVRVIIQDEGFSRGFGVFGGSLIDADLVRPGTGRGDSSGGVGKDNFGEMFPTFFLEALAPSRVFDPAAPGDQTRRLAAIEITADGTGGGYAEVTVRGYGGDFLALTQTINEFILDDPRDAPNLMFTTHYRLRPGKRYVEIETIVQNVAFPERTLRLPNSFAGVNVPAPFGDVVLFGAGNEVFLPHEAGYNVRFTLEDVYAAGNIELPALPGIAAEYMATSGADVSYGLLAAAPADPELNFVYKNREFFPDATPHSLHVPFIASAFTGVFQVVPPAALAPNDRQPGGEDEYRFSRYFIIGHGDVASISEVVHEILGDETGTVEGRLRDSQTGATLADASVVFLEAGSEKKVTQASTDRSGRFRAKMRPGRYRAIVHKKGRDLSAAQALEVTAKGLTFLDLQIAPPARVTITVVEPGVGPVPAKVSLVGTAPLSFAGRDPKTWLFDLGLGQSFRFTDLEPDTDDASTRRYLETFDYTTEGTVVLTGRPGTYTLVASRGPEYSRQEIVGVELVAGTHQSFTMELKRVVDTTGYVAADFHVHSVYSLDSFDPLDERIKSYAGEGLELVAATDHNFVVDYAPTIAALGMERFITSLVGLELTTIDRGHFNAFPLRMGDSAIASDGDGNYLNTIASRTRGSFQWAQRRPQEIFDDLRALAPKEAGCLRDNRDNPKACADLVEKVIVQVNHPRDSILGYFDQYVLRQGDLFVKGQSGLVGANVQANPEFHPTNFSWDFDAIELFNGKRFEMLRNFRVPEGLPINPDLGQPLDPSSCCPLTPGAVYRQTLELDCDSAARDCACTTADAEAQIAAGRCAPLDIAFPGAVDDWFQILRTGKRLVGTANSDSHEPHKEEPGYPRTYVRVPHDSPRLVTPQDVVSGFLSGDVLMTNGPFAVVEARGDGGSRAGMGGMVDAAGGEVILDVEVRHTPWARPRRVTVWLNGERAAEAELTQKSEGVMTASFALAPERDGFVIVEVAGDDNMFPTVFPQEIPPVQFTDVIDALGDSLGFLADGGLRPPLIFQSKPYALTNPIWIDADGDGELTPSLVIPVRDEQAAARVELDGPAGANAPVTAPLLDARGEWAQFKRTLPPRKRRTYEEQLPEWLWPTDNPRDVRRVLVQFLRHGH